MNIFIIFDVILWIAIWITTVVVAMILYSFVRIENRRNENFFWTMLISLCYSFGIYAHYEPRRGFIRFFTGCMLFFGLNFNAAYQSFMLSVLTMPRYEHQIANIHEAIHAGYRFTGGENLKALFEEGKDYAAAHLLEHYESCLKMDKCLLELKTDHKLAFAISRQHALNAKVPVSDMDIYCFEKADNIFSFSVVMLFKKDHHLLPRVNTLIRRITESGFILKWRTDAELIKFRENLQRRRDDEATVNRAINLNQLIGAFGLGGVGMIVAAIAFSSEWIVFYFAQKKRVRFMLFVERKVMRA
jgi:hypothetical protein